MHSLFMAFCREGRTAELGLSHNRGIILVRDLGLYEWGLVHSGEDLQLVLLMN